MKTFILILLSTTSLLLTGCRYVEVQPTTPITRYMHNNVYTTNIKVKHTEVQNSNRYVKHDVNYKFSNDIRKYEKTSYENRPHRKQVNHYRPVAKQKYRSQRPDNDLQKRKKMTKKEKTRRDAKQKYSKALKQYKTASYDNRSYTKHINRSEPVAKQNKRVKRLDNTVKKHRKIEEKDVEKERQNRRKKQKRD